MKRILLTIAILFAITSIKAQDTWTQKADFGGTGRNNAVAFSIGNKGYIGTGYSSVEWYKDFWEYDVMNNVWTQKADFGGNNREKAVAFSIKGKGYIGTGIFSDDSGADYPYKDLWEYDPATNMWIQKKDFGGEARYDAVGFAIGGKGYIGTGTSHGFYNDFWEYDPATDNWKRIADFGGIGRSLAVGFSLGNKGYVGTGGGSGGYYNDFWEYDPTADLWLRKADFGGPERYNAVGFSLGSKGYIATGTASMTNAFMKDIWEYNPTSNTWLQKTNLDEGERSSAVCFTIGNKGYVSTGYWYDYNAQRLYYYKDLWEYTPDEEADTCTSPSGLAVLKVADTAALLSWAIPIAPVNNYKIRYRALGTKTFLKRSVKGTSTQVILRGLQSNTTYQWQMRSNCSSDTSVWVCGPDFTTTVSIASYSNSSLLNAQTKTGDGVGIKVMPNPNNGNFILQMQLPDRRTATTIALYNAAGKKVWQQQLGSINGYINYPVNIDNRMSTGIYTLRVERTDLQLTQKLIVNK